jgi:hypothetical protein
LDASSLLEAVSRHSAAQFRLLKVEERARSLIYPDAYFSPDRHGDRNSAAAFERIFALGKYLELHRIVRGP